MYFQSYLQAILLALSASAVTCAPIDNTAAPILTPRQVKLPPPPPPPHVPIWGPVYNRPDTLLSRATLSNWFRFLEADCKGYKWDNDWGLRSAPDCVYQHIGRMKQMCDVPSRPDQPLCMKEYAELYAPISFKWNSGGDEGPVDGGKSVDGKPVGGPPADDESVDG